MPHVFKVVRASLADRIGEGGQAGLATSIPSYSCIH